MKPKTLKPGKHWNKNRVQWCGPTALALLTGRTLQYCHRKLAKVRKMDQRYLRGVQNWDMLRALKEMGFDAYPCVVPRQRNRKGKILRPTLRQYIDELQSTAEFRETCLIEITRHYVIAHRGLVCDNHWTDPVPPVVHQWNRRRVQSVWVIRPLAR